MRKAGYRPAENRYGEESFVRSLGQGPFPRFHIYADAQQSAWALNLHLDQRRPSYEGTRAHGGEHEGPVLEVEVARLRSVLV